MLQINAIACKPSFAVVVLLLLLMLPTKFCLHVSLLLLPLTWLPPLLPLLLSPVQVCCTP
jgi:hypothetical protein